MRNKTQFGCIISLLGALNLYKVPEMSKVFGTTYPVSIDFDSKGNVYFVGIRMPVLWFGNTTQMKNGTSNGINKIPIPTDGFKGISPDLIRYRFYSSRQ